MEEFLQDMAELKKDNAELKAFVNTYSVKMAELEKDNVELKTFVNNHVKDNSELKGLINANDMKIDTHERKLLTLQFSGNAPVTVFNQQGPTIYNKGASFTLASSPFTMGEGINQISLSFSHWLSPIGGAVTVTLTLSTAKSPKGFFTYSRNYRINVPESHTARSFTFHTPSLSAKQQSVTATLKFDVNTAGSEILFDADDYFTMTTFAMIP